MDLLFEKAADGSSGADTMDRCAGCLLLKDFGAQLAGDPYHRTRFCATRCPARAEYRPVHLARRLRRPGASSFDHETF